jgi:hypothetical protein
MFGLFKKPAPPPFDEDAEAFRLLQATPRATAFVVIGSPRYSQVFKGEVIAPISVVERKVNEVFGSTFGGSKERRVARKAFPLWLANADRASKALSYLPSPFVSTIDAYVNEFVVGGDAQVFCPHCRAPAEQVEILKSDESSSKVHKEWTEEWRCQAGHSLYREQHEMRFTY